MVLQPPTPTLSSPNNPDPVRLVIANRVIGTGVELGPGCAVGPGAEIGDGTRLGAGCMIGRGVTIGKNCEIGGNVTRMPEDIGAQFA